MNILQGSNWHESYSGLVEMLWSFSSSFFQLGVGPPPQPSRSAADPPPSLVSCQPTSVHWDVKKEPVRQVKVGKRHSMILSSGGRVATFGSGLYHQLGHGQTENEWTPRMVRAPLVLEPILGHVHRAVSCASSPPSTGFTTRCCSLPSIRWTAWRAWARCSQVGHIRTPQHPHPFHPFILPLPSTCPTQLRSHLNNAVPLCRRSIQRPCCHRVRRLALCGALHHWRGVHVGVEPLRPARLRRPEPLAPATPPTASPADTRQPGGTSEGTRGELRSGASHTIPLVVIMHIDMG